MNLSHLEYTIERFRQCAPKIETVSNDYLGSKSEAEAEAAEDVVKLDELVA